LESKYKCGLPEGVTETRKPITTLVSYNKKRNFEKTSEPKGILKVTDQGRKLRDFVVQKHDATRLHYDFRLESEEGVLKSWAVPKGPSMDPDIKRLAVLVEDHPLDYLLFEGSIRPGNYGAGTVIVWDTGSYSSKDNISDQMKRGKISVQLYGNKLKGLFSLVRTKRDNQWLLIKSRDEYASNEDVTVKQPDSVLTGRSNSDIEFENESPSIGEQKSKVGKSKLTSSVGSTNGKEIESFPQIKPMLASPVEKPFNNKGWVFEVKWDGVRAIIFKHKKVIKIQSRNGNDITQKYPEIVNEIKNSVKDCESAIVDGEIVVLNENGVPDFHAHQHRMNVQNSREIMALSVETPATYYLFDILYKDGKDLKSLNYLDRRRILSSTIMTNKSIRISDYIEEKGIDMLDSTNKLNLEGIVAKHKNSTYREGIRSKEWLKIKNTKTQDCVVIGYTKGEGVRDRYFGSLVLAVYSSKEKKLKFAGHAGTGFDDETLNLVYSKMKREEIGSMPVDKVPYLNRETTWLNPILIAEVKFSEWTKDGVLRAPVFLRLREDKKPEECVTEADNPMKISTILQIVNKSNQIADTKNNKNDISSMVTVTNPEKVYWKGTKDHPKFLKKNLIEYYEAMAAWILPHLKDRPLSLSRYPNGISGKSFYQKDWDQKKPNFVTTAQIHSEHRGDSINYIICNNVETLLWIANLGCIEMHPWYSRIKYFDGCDSSSLLYEEKCGLNFPDYIVFDLDPYIYSGKEKKGQEPEYNIPGFKAAVEIAYELKHILEGLKINSYVKTSGKSGLHVYVPISNNYPYEQTKNFAEVMAKLMVSKFPKKVTTEWNTTKRKGKVFFDYNQNARGKTIASVFSLRPTPTATVSMPVSWKKLDSVVPTEYTILSAPKIIRTNEAWQDILSDKQDLREIISKAKEIT
jgi:bifunctional non-homologous end joining protein LigD